MARERPAPREQRRRRNAETAGRAAAEAKVPERRHERAAERRRKRVAPAELGVREEDMGQIDLFRGQQPARVPRRAGTPVADSAVHRDAVRLGPVAARRQNDDLGPRLAQRPREAAEEVCAAVPCRREAAEDERHPRHAHRRLTASAR